MKTNWKELFQDNNISVEREYERSRDKHNNPFVALTSGGIKQEGEVFPVLYATDGLAWNAFEDTLLVWLDGRRQVHLRHAPSMEQIKFFQDKIESDWYESVYYAVFCRLTAY